MQIENQRFLRHIYTVAEVESISPQLLDTHGRFREVTPEPIDFIDIPSMAVALALFSEQRA